MRISRLAKQTSGTLSEPDLELPYLEVQIDSSRHPPPLRYANTNRLSVKRVKTLLTKEPTTTAWLESFDQSDVLYDVGANVGMYSIYAAVLTGCRVVALEPSSLNYAELNKNIYLNRLGERVRGHCIGVSDRFAMSTLYLSRFVSGFSHHDAGENRWGGQLTNLVASPELRPREGCVLMPLEQVAELSDWKPTQVKIDVDGLEGLVVKGMRSILMDPAVRSILIETDHKLEDSIRTFEILPQFGWRYSIDQVTAARSERLTEEQWRSLVARRKGGTNVIWFKDDRYVEFFRQFKERYKPVPE